MLLIEIYSFSVVQRGINMLSLIESYFVVEESKHEISTPTFTERHVGDSVSQLLHECTCSVLLFEHWGFTLINSHFDMRDKSGKKPLDM